MGLFDKLSEVVEEVVDDVLPALDPTNPNAAYGNVTQAVGEAVVTGVTAGSGAGLFTSVTKGIGTFHEVTDNAFTANNFEETVDSISEKVSSVDLESIELDPEVLVDEVLPSLDPTNPNSEYGDDTQKVAEEVLTSVFGESAGGLFTKVTDGIGDLNEETDNTFTLNNLRDVVSEVDNYDNSVSLEGTFTESSPELAPIESSVEDNTGCIFFDEAELQAIEAELRAVEDSELSSIEIIPSVEDSIEYSSEFDYYNLCERQVRLRVSMEVALANQ